MMEWEILYHDEETIWCKKIFLCKKSREVELIDNNSCLTDHITLTYYEYVNKISGSNKVFRYTIRYYWCHITLVASLPLFVS